MFPSILSSSDISSVPAEFVKYFLMTGGFFLGVWFAYRKGRQSSGTKEEPVNIAMPVEVKKSAEYAHKADLEAMKRHIQEVQQAGHERRVEIIEAIHGSERRMIQEVKDLHERLNPVAEGFRGHANLLDQIDKRLSEAERARREESLRMHQRVDDAIRAAAQNSSKK